MLKEHNKTLHDLIRTLIDIEMAIINGKYEQAYHLLRNMKVKGMDAFFSEMRGHVKEKLFELYGEKLS